MRILEIGLCSVADFGVESCYLLFHVCVVLGEFGVPGICKAPCLFCSAAVNFFFIDDAYDGLVLQGLFGIADALLSFVALRFGFLALKPGGNAGLFCVVCPLRHLSALLL